MFESQSLQTRREMKRREKKEGVAAVFRLRGRMKRKEKREGVAVPPLADMLSRTGLRHPAGRENKEKQQVCMARIVATVIL
jgi:hypothetical protein